MFEISDFKIEGLTLKGYGKFQFSLVKAELKLSRSILIHRFSYLKRQIDRLGFIESLCRINCIAQLNKYKNMIHY